MIKHFFQVFVLGVSLLSCKAQKPEAVLEKPKPVEKKPIIVKEDTVVQKVPERQRPYNFLLLLPADLAEAFTNDTITPDSIVVRESYSRDLTDAIHFYEGAVLAVDSLRKAGNDIRLKVVDLPWNEERQVTKVWIQKYDTMDVVFSMLKGKPLKTLNRVLSGKKIPLISCATNSCAEVEKNPRAVCVQPSSLTQCALAGAYARDRFKSDNIIIITGTSDKEKERYAAFLSAFRDSAARARIKKVNLSEGGEPALTKALSLTYTNTLFFPSTDEDLVSTLYSILRSYEGTYRFRVVGLPVWQLFETMDPRMLEKYNTILFTAEYYSYDEHNTLLFRKKFRQSFSTEPRDAAYLGYDSFLQFGKLFIDKQLPFDVPETNLKGLRGKYQFYNADSAAAENHYIDMIKIENFRYVKMSREN